jgi:tRNA1(Val) A37 N6-methylase TrmN6
MNFLRQKLFGMTPAERHDYFIRHLAAVEKDPFAVEISRLALTLADFPNPGGWDIAPKDVFEPGALTYYLPRTGVVLCNPPFEDFDKEERERYHTASTKKPAELLQRVLRDLHPDGVIGFVVPRNFLDGQGYAQIRKSLAARFATLDLTVLPD